MKDKEWEENPFENRPGEKRASPVRAARKPEASESSLPDADEENPFGRIAEPAGAPIEGGEVSPFESEPSSTGYEYDTDEDRLGLDEFDKSKLALISAMGFGCLVLVMYFFVIVRNDGLLLALAVLSIIVSALVAFFYLLDDLRVRISSMTERGARFISGIFMVVLVTILLAPIAMQWPNVQDAPISIPLTLLPVIILTHASVALFLYSMLWEE